MCIPSPSGRKICKQFAFYLVRVKNHFFASPVSITSFSALSLEARGLTYKIPHKDAKQASACLQAGADFALPSLEKLSYLSPQEKFQNLVLTFLALI